LSDAQIVEQLTVVRGIGPMDSGNAPDFTLAGLMYGR